VKRSPDTIRFLRLELVCIQVLGETRDIAQSEFGQSATLIVILDGEPQQPSPLIEGIFHGEICWRRECAPGIVGTYSRRIWTR